MGACHRSIFDTDGTCDDTSVVRFPVERIVTLLQLPLVRRNFETRELAPFCSDLTCLL
jgi:hypothetical protein